jgi:hypothetical protein
VGSLVTIPRHKGDQTGENTKPKHVYSNLFKPEICPVLALALFVFSYAYRATSTSSNNSGMDLFEGPAPESAFTKWLHTTALNGLTEEELGIAKREIGTHSFRKGSATYVSSFDVLSETSIDIRAGWSIGRVRGKYVFGTPGSDQLIGRILSGLNIHVCEDFLVLPPHFDNREVMNFVEWKEIMNDFINHTLSFRQTLEYLIATMTYHYDWILQNCNPYHPIFTSRIWTNGILIKLKPFLEIRKRKCECSLIATGVPTLWSAIGIFDEIDKKLDKSINIFQSYREELVQFQNDLPMTICETLQENFNIDGIAPITIAQLKLTMKENNDLILQQMKANSPANSTILLEVNDIIAEGNYPTWTWGGRIHYVPQTFKFPSCTTKALWDLWFYGTEVPDKIRPYRFFKGFEMNLAGCKSKLVKAGMLINVLIKAGNNLKLQDLTNMCYSENQKHFYSLFDVVCNEIKDARAEEKEDNPGKRIKSRFSQLKWLSVFNEISKYRIYNRQK